MAHNQNLFDSMLMGDLRRLAAAQELLASETVLRSILEEISARMTPIFGDSADFSGVTKTLRKIKAKYDRFVNFIAKPGVVYNEGTNSITITRAYSARSTRRETLEERHFRFSGFQHYEACDFVFNKKHCSPTTLRAMSRFIVRPRNRGGEAIIPDEDYMTFLNHVTRYYPNTDPANIPWDRFMNESDDGSDDGGSVLTDG